MLNPQFNSHMIIIELKHLRIQAFHGIYAGEKKTGSPYEVNVRVGYEEGTTEFDSLEDTINYEEVFTIVKQRMLIATPILEKVAQDIIRKIKHRYPFTREVLVSVYKLEAPMENFEGKIGVTMEKKFE